MRHKSRPTEHEGVNNMGVWDRFQGRRAVQRLCSENVPGEFQSDWGGQCDWSRVDRVGVEGV